MNCVVCQEPLHDLVNPKAVRHPTCDYTYDAPTGQEDPLASLLKQRLTEVITWADAESPRSKQVLMGPSEIGDPCTRRIGYRLAEVPACNTWFDPWAAIVGTACHSWLDAAVSQWLAANGSDEFNTETELAVSEFVQGHSDLYWRPHRMVVDYKTAGPTAMKKLKADGPSVGYQTQTHMYGYGFERMGWPVEKVALVFLPRAGWLRDMVVWTADYDRGVAQAALDRQIQIAHTVVSLDILTHSHRWEQLEAVPSNACGWCPWFNSMKDKDSGADAYGCPGR